MAGLCGVIGNSEIEINSVTEQLCYRGNEHTAVYDGENVKIGYVDHPIEYSKQPIKLTNENTLIWIWGTVVGYKDKSGYLEKKSSVSDVEFCSNLYLSKGKQFINGLNGEFCGIIYDSNMKTISLFTDRLGSYPLYYMSVDENFIFTTSIQTLNEFPDIKLSVNKKTLPIYLRYGITPGTTTLMEGVKTVSPASLITINPSGEIVEEFTYWWPNPTKKDISFHSFVNEFQDRFINAVQDRTVANQRHGLLLSGGTDSRAVLSALNVEAVCFHMNEKMNTEARNAKRAADRANMPFQFLERDLSYYPNVLKGISNITNFDGAFYRASAKGFEPEITSQVDILFSGTYSDSMIERMYAPTESVRSNLLEYSLPSLPKRKSIKSVEDFVNSFHAGEMWGLPGSSSFTRGLADPKEALQNFLTEDEHGITFGGVRYPSWRSLVEFGRMYPLTQSHGSIEHIDFIPVRYPFLDNRLIDHILKMPYPCGYKKHVVEAAIAEINPELGRFPFTVQSRPIQIPYELLYYMHYLRKYTLILKKKMIESETDKMLSGSWPNHDTIIREHPFVREIINDNEDRIKSSSHFDYDGIITRYEEISQNKNDSFGDIYLLITMLESNVSIN